MHGFKLKENVGRTAKAMNFPLRYGKGVYFSNVSGKANDYANSSEQVLICYVGVGVADRADVRVVVVIVMVVVCVVDLVLFS